MAEPIVTPTPEPEIKPEVKIEFSPAQQEHINNLFNRRFAAVSTKHEAELREMSARIEALKTAPPVVPVVVPPVAKDDDTVRQMKDFLAQEKENTKTMKLALDAEKQDKARVIEENKKILKDQAIAEAAASLPNGVEFHELKTVKKLVEDDISFDGESNQWVVKENGNVKMNSSMEPMNLVEYFATFAAARPYLVKGTVKSGTGAAESGRSSAHLGTSVIRTKADIKTVKEKVDFITKFGYPAFAALPTGKDAAQEIRDIIRNSPRR